MPKQTIDHRIVLRPPAHDYREASKALELRFGSHTSIIEANTKQPADGPTIAANDCDALYDFAPILRNRYVILSQYNAQNTLDSQC